MPRHEALKNFYYIGSRDATLRVWNVESAQAVQVLQGHQYQVHDV